MTQTTSRSARTRPVRVVLAKPGLDGHDQGAKVVARALRDAGFEVIYTGLRQTPEAVCRIALEEDVDVVALSSMAGSHLPFCTRLAPMLREAGLDDKLWVIGGNLPAQDHAALRALGFDGIFPTGSKLTDIVAYLEERTQAPPGSGQRESDGPPSGGRALATSSERGKACLRSGQASGEDTQ